MLHIWFPFCLPAFKIVVGKPKVIFHYSNVSSNVILRCDPFKLFGPSEDVHICHACVEPDNSGVPSTRADLGVRLFGCPLKLKTGVARASAALGGPFVCLLRTTQNTHIAYRRSKSCAPCKEPPLLTLPI